jgi:hypothetical protein
MKTDLEMRFGLREYPELTDVLERTMKRLAERHPVNARKWAEVMAEDVMRFAAKREATK